MTANQGIESWARYYDLESSPDDLNFYRSLVDPTDDVLELGCGTGRITIPLAEECHFICGIDSSQTMLSKLEDKLVRLQTDLHNNVFIDECDIRCFALGQRFDLIIAPYRVIQHLVDDDDVRSTCECISTHLKPGGTCVLNVSNPRYPNLDREAFVRMWRAMIADTPQWRPNWRTKTDDNLITCDARCVSVDSERLVVYPEFRYRVWKEQQLLEETVSGFPWRCYFPDEFDTLIRNRFEIVNRWGGYEGEEYGAGRDLVIQCRNPGRAEGVGEVASGY